MNTPSNIPPESVLDPPGTAPPAMTATRPLYWSVRRELWENRWVYIAPIAVAAVVLFASLISTLVSLSRRVSAGPATDLTKPYREIGLSYSAIAGVAIAAAFIVGVFYCLEALHGERRDRSILFWKSLPVSDRTTVLSKAAIPLVVLPLLALGLIVTSQLILMLLSTAALLGNPPAVGALWARLPFLRMSAALLYALIAIALWHAPIYGWLLLVSVWARRAAFLWAALPLLAVCLFEWIVFRTSHFALLLRYRLIGWFTQGFAFQPHGAVYPLTSLTPGRLLSTPGLWIGLVLAAAFLTAAVRLRRHREPI